MSYIVATSVELPYRYYKQQELADALREHLAAANVDFDLDIIDRVFCRSRIQGRHFALPVPRAGGLVSTSTANKAGIEAAVDLCESAITTLLDKVALAPQDISLIGSVSLFPAMAVPSLEARLMNRLPFRPSTKRLPLCGVGCAGGAFGVARIADYLEAHPDEAVIFLSCEIVSLCWQGSCERDLIDLIRRMPDDPSIPGRVMSAIVCTALFGDGVAAVLMAGDRHPLAQSGGCKVIGSRSMLTPNTEHLVGADLADTGFRGTLHPGLPEMASKGLRLAVDSLLSEQGVLPEQIDQWILHAGGPKVMDAVQKEFGLSPFALDAVRETFARAGNVESTSVLLVLDEFLADAPPPPGSYAILGAMGPGFCQEVSLLQWV